MAQQFVSSPRHAGTSRYPMTPFILAMIDASGNLVDLPYPSQAGMQTPDRIMGVELMVNPASISNNMAKMVTRTQTMTAWFEEHWGEELDTITFQGSSAAFVTGGTDIYDIKLSSSGTSKTKTFIQTGSLASTPLVYEDDLLNYIGDSANPVAVGSGVNDDEIGLTTSRRRWAVSYIQFKRLVDLFRSNGCMFDDFGRITNRYYIMLSYGKAAYKGYFESLDITEDATMPFKFVFTVTFKSEETVYSFIDPGKVSVFPNGD